MTLKCPCCGTNLILPAVIETAPDGSPFLTMEQIMDIVSRHSGIPAPYMRHRSRRREWTRARHQVMWLARRYSSSTLLGIGMSLGGRDHTTVIHGITTINDMMTVYPAVRDEMAMLAQMCENMRLPMMAEAV